MINRLVLSQWKAYSHADVRFEPGTTFLVATNGVGKTSIIQGLHFAIFGGDRLIGPSGSPVSNAIRGVADEATVECELVLGGHSVAIERVVRRGPSSGAVAQSITVDRTEVTPRQWADLVTESTGMDPSQLSNLAIVAEGSVLQTRDAGVDVASSLAAIFGVDKLQSAAAELDRIANRIDRETDQRRKALKATSAHDDAQSKLEIEKRLSASIAALKTFKEREEAVEHAEARRLAWQRFRDAEAAHVLTVADWNAQVAALGDRVTKASSRQSIAAETLADLEEVVGVLRDETVATKARLEADLAAAQRALMELDAGTAICPTCLRPLSPAETDRAREQHGATTERVSSELSRPPIQLRLFDDIHRNLQLLQRSRPSSPPSPPDLPEPVIDAAEGEDLEPLRAQISEEEQAVAQARAELALLARQSEQRTADNMLSVELQSRYRISERAAVAAQTMKVLAERVRAERIAPLTAEVEKRWPDLWAGDALSMDGSGRLALSTAGGTVAFSEFSGGQRTIAHVLVRLLTLQMATTCPFLVLDEPLEHLDSTHRRSLAALLVKASQRETPLRQVVVTTYEETVTRRLSARPLTASAGNPAQVQYVRATPE